jgi:hypothetical protein
LRAKNYEKACHFYIKQLTGGHIEGQAAYVLQQFISVPLESYLIQYLEALFEMHINDKIPAVNKNHIDLLFYYYMKHGDYEKLEY